MNNRGTRTKVKSAWVKVARCGLLCSALHKSSTNRNWSRHMQSVNLCFGTAGLNWQTQREADLSSMTSQAQTAAGQLKPDALSARTATEYQQKQRALRRLWFTRMTSRPHAGNLLWDNLCNHTRIQLRAYNLNILKWLRSQRLLCLGGNDKTADKSRADLWSNELPLI